MQFTLDVQRKKILCDHHFEIQEMDNFLYTQAFTIFNADKDYKIFAKKILAETITAPFEARQIDFFNDDFEALTEVINEIMELQEAFMKPKAKRKGIRKKQL